MLTSEQKCTLRTDMDTHAELTAAIAATDTATIAAFYNADAPGGELAWVPNLDINDVWEAIDWAEYVALSLEAQGAFTALTRFGFLATGLANVQAGLGQIFAGAGQINTRTSLLAIARRVMTRGELLFADTTGDPATLVIEGDISTSDVLWALTNC